MTFSRFFILHPVATTLLMIGLFLAGMLGYRQLSVASLPDVEFPVIQVSASMPGGSPETMAQTITTPLEHRLGQIVGLVAMTSTSSIGYASITLQFDLGRDIDLAAQDVQAAISAAMGALPKSLVDPPTYSKVNPADTPIMVLALTSDSVPLAKVTEFADSVLVQKLSQIDGVGLATMEGGQKPAIRLQMNPAKLALMGLTMEDVRASVQAATAQTPKGSIETPRQSHLIATEDLPFMAEAFESLILAYRNDAPIRLADAGRAVDGAENAKQAGWYNSKPAVILNIQRRPGTNIVETVDRLHAALPQLRASLPPNLHLDIVADRTHSIHSSIDEVYRTMIMTAMLVVMIIFIFLRKLWATVIPGVVLLLSVVGTFGIMHLAGFSLNNLTLMALTIAIGFVVDDAIVMLENIVRLMEGGEKPQAAALKGARQIAFTIVSLTISLVSVLIPLLFMGGVLGRLFREFAVTLSAAVVISAIVSLTLTPMMCAHFLRAEVEPPSSPFFRMTERLINWSRQAYERSLLMALRRQGLILVFTAATMVLTLALFVSAPKGFLPHEDTGLVMGIVDAAPDVTFARLKELQVETARLVGSDPDVAGVVSFVGVGPSNPTPNTGRMLIVLKPQAERSAGAEQIIERLSARARPLAGISFFAQTVQDIQIDTKSSRTQYQYLLQSPAFEELSRWSQALLVEMRRQPELQDVASDLQMGAAQAEVDVNRAAAARFGIRQQDIDDTLYDAFGQRQIGSVFTPVDQYHLILETDPDLRPEPETLAELHVKAANGRPVPLGALATVTRSSAPLALSHADQLPTVTLSFNLAPGMSLGQAMAAIQRAERAVAMPDGVARSFVGRAALFQESLSSQPFLIAATIIVVYIVLGILYESYAHPLTIISTLPSAGVGALLALRLTGHDLSIVALIGIILLIGIVKKNAIMMIDFALDAMRSRKIGAERAIIEACLLRFRPIMMTTMAALLGALPLAFSAGEGSELRRPLGLALVGGLLVSQFLTLYTTPVVYLAFERLGDWTRRRAKKALRDAPVKPA